jgi:hypothetical protein
MTKRITPAIFWAAYGLTAVWAIAQRIALVVYPPGAPRIFLLRPFAFGIGLMAANALALRLSLQVRRDFPRRARMRVAWVLFALSCATALLRYGLLWVAAGRGVAPDLRPALFFGAGITEGASLLLLLAALVLMWRSFWRLRLGRLRLSDGLAIAAIAIATPALFALRAGGPLASARTFVILQLQYLDPALIACCAVAGVVLLRTSRDVGAGSLAASFACVGAFGLVRLAALLVALLPVPGIRWIEVPFTAASLASDWLIALAVWYRWRVTVEANELVRHYDSDPTANS